ncbi:MAG: response regulator, partial [Mycobacteriales bacterium]
AVGLQDAVAKLGLQLRAGVHTGECVRRGEEISGIGVNIAQRIMAEGQAGEILVSSTVRDIVAGSRLELHDRGFRALRGVPGTWRLFCVAGARPPGRRGARRDATPVVLSLMIVDDHPMWRQTLRAVLEGSGVGTVVAEAGDGEEAVETAIAARPEAVIMDMNLISMNGVTATRRILEALPDTKVLMLSSSDEKDDVVAAVHAGASGYLLKTAGPEEVADAVERVRAGELVFPPVLAKVVLDEFRRGAKPRNKKPTKSARS